MVLTSTPGEGPLDAAMARSCAFVLWVSPILSVRRSLGRAGSDPVDRDAGGRTCPADPAGRLVLACA